MYNVTTAARLKRVLGRLLRGSLLILFSLTSLGASTVGLAWNPSTDSSVAGYNVYYGTATHSYQVQVPVGTNVDGDGCRVVRWDDVLFCGDGGGYVRRRERFFVGTFRSHAGQCLSLDFADRRPGCQCGPIDCGDCFHGCRMPETPAGSLTVSGRFIGHDTGAERKHRLRRLGRPTAPSTVTPAPGLSGLGADYCLGQRRDEHDEQPLSSDDSGSDVHQHPADDFSDRNPDGDLGPGDLGDSVHRWVMRETAASSLTALRLFVGHDVGAEREHCIWRQRSESHGDGDAGGGADGIDADYVDGQRRHTYGEQRCSL